MKLSLKSKGKSLATKVRCKVKVARERTKDKVQRVDWKKVGKVALKVCWELAKIGINIGVGLAVPG